MVINPVGNQAVFKLIGQSNVWWTTTIILPSASTLNIAVASKFVAQGKCWFRKLTPRYGFVAWRSRAWLEMKAQSPPPLSRTPKDTSHWWVYYAVKCGYKTLPLAYSFATVISEWGSETIFWVWEIKKINVQQSESFKMPYFIP